MQRNKGIKNISEIQDYCKDSAKLISIFTGLLKSFNLNYINTILAKSKKRGVATKQIFQILFILPFLELKNIQQLRFSGYFNEVHFGKDVFYEFMKNPLINWRSIVRLFYRQAEKIIKQESDPKDNKQPSFFIVDDSLIPKTGKRTEFIGKVHNHNSRSYELGMKMLTLGISDGKTFLPIDFSIHNEQGKLKNRGLKAKDLKRQFTKHREENTPSYQRMLEVSEDKISNSISMIKRAVKKGIKAKYVLADSWFVSEKFLLQMKQTQSDLFVIGLMKTNRIVQIQGKSHKANKIPELKRKEIKHSRKLKCHYISLKIKYRGIELKAYWVRMKGQQTWKMLISADLKLSFIKAMEYYQIRWSIEVFFKDCKQNLRLNACQSVDFDSHIAHISIVFMNYTLLALKRRIEDYETLGALFRHLKELLLKETLIEKIWKLFIDIFNSLFSELGIDWEILIEKIICHQQDFQNQIINAFQCLFSCQIYQEE